MSERGSAERGENGGAYFGSRPIRPDEKQGLVDDVFHKVAARYDLMND